MEIECIRSCSIPSLSVIAVVGERRKVSPQLADQLVRTGRFVHVKEEKVEPKPKAPRVPKSEKIIEQYTDYTLRPIVKEEKFLLDLKDKGIQTIQDLASAKPDDLTEIKGVGEITAIKWIDSAIEAISEESE